jgi:hypothetical protein
MFMPLYDVQEPINSDANSSPADLAKIVVCVYLPRACFNGSPGLPRGRSFHRPRTFNSSLSTWKNLLRGVMARISWRILASSKSSPQRRPICRFGWQTYKCVYCETLKSGWSSVIRRSAPLTELQPLFIEVHRQRTDAAVSVL